MVNAIGGQGLGHLNSWSAVSAPPGSARTPTVGPSMSAAELLSQWSAAKLGVSEDALRKATARGTISVGTDGAGALRLAGGVGIVTSKGSLVPTTPDGVPDVIAMLDAGAEIIGAATGGGEPVVANQSQFGLKAYWAFQVDFHDGNWPQWVKGGTADPGPQAGPGTRVKVFADLVDTVDRLPNSLLDFMRQLEHREGTLYDDKPPANRIDLLA